MLNYSIITMLSEFRDKKPLIEAYLKKKSVESYDGNGEGEDKVLLFGMTVGVALVFMVIILALWIWALIVTINYWNFLPTWAKVFAIIGLLTMQFGGPVMTLIVVYITKNSNKSGFKYRSRHY